MAQVIKIKRGGLANLVATTPTLVQGELLLATGSLNGLKSTFFVASASDSPSLPYAKIESISDGPALGSSLDNNFEGLLIHSASDNKFYRFNGSSFVELPIAAGSFVGILPVTNGGTGQSTLTDGAVLIGNGTSGIDQISLSTGQLLIGRTAANANPAAATLTAANGIVITNGDGSITIGAGGNLVSGSSQISFTGISNVPSGLVSGSSQISFTGISNVPSGLVSGSSQISYTGLSNVPSGIVSASSLSSAAQGSVSIVVNGVTAAATDLGLETTDSPTFVGLTLTGDLAVNGGDITSTSATFNFVTSNATALNIGSGSATTTLNGAIVNVGNTGNTTATTINLGNSANNATINVKGNLNVLGTTTTINSTIVNIDDNIINLNYGGAQSTGGINVRDVTGGNTATGSLLWDGTNDYWKAGSESNEKRIIRIQTGDTFAAAERFVGTKGEDTLDSFNATTDGHYLKYNGSALEVTNIIDGGTF